MGVAIAFPEFEYIVTVRSILYFAAMYAQSETAEIAESDRLMEPICTR